MKLGFYLHTSWEFEYPFAVRSWQREDFAGWCELMKRLDMNLLMLWPLCEVMPPPLSAEDEAVLLDWKGIVADAKARGLETWITQTPNCTTRPEIAAKPFEKRHFYPFRVDVRLDDPAAREAYFQHRAALMRVLDNADGYVTIDGDPGGYPDATPQALLDVFQHDRQTLDALNRPDAQLVPWLWSGWGGDWGAHGAWQEPLEPLTRPVLELLKNEMPQPFTLLPGRSNSDHFCNGRKNFALVEEAGLIEQSVLLCYEIIEYEPTPPAINLQFDDIRRVLRQEKSLIEKSRGVMGNAQQPIMAVPNMYFFARAAREPEYLNRGDEEVLRDLAAFLGGEAEILVPAWQSGRLPLERIPADLPERLRSSRLASEAAACLPGGAQKYLEILASWVQARLRVLAACAPASGESETAANLARGIAALADWWKVHRYVCTGEFGDGFLLQWTHPLLLAPLQNYCAPLSGDCAALKIAVINRLCDGDCLPRAAAETAVHTLLD